MCTLDRSETKYSNNWFSSYFSVLWQYILLFKYMINIIWYGIFRITSRINPLPISSRELCDTERAIYILYIFIVGYMCIFIVNWMQRAIIYTNMWLVLHKDRYNITYNVYFKMYFYLLFVLVSGISCSKILVAII
jgi:hypothetical protein